MREDQAGSVEVPKSNCSNCSAPMRFTAFSEEYHCEHCGTAHVPSIGFLDGIRVLDVQSDLSCPICRLELRHAEADRWSLLMCAECGGAFVEGIAFWEIVQYRRQMGTGVSSSGFTSDDGDRRLLSCPRCSDSMQCHPYFGPGDFQVDACNRCKTVWLDRGELAEATVAYSPHDGRGV